MHDIPDDLVFDLRGHILAALRNVRAGGDTVSGIAQAQARLESGFADAPPRPTPAPCRCGCGKHGDNNRRGLAYACWKAATADGTLDTHYPTRRSRGNPLEWRGRQGDPT